MCEKGRKEERNENQKEESEENKVEKGVKEKEERKKNQRLPQLLGKQCKAGDSRSNLSLTFQILCV